VTSAQIATAGSATVMVTTPSSLGAILGQGESLEEGGRVTFVFLSGY
jgi:hypothetical protein